MRLQTLISSMVARKMNERPESMEIVEQELKQIAERLMPYRARKNPAIYRNNASKRNRTKDLRASAGSTVDVFPEIDSKPSIVPVSLPAPFVTQSVEQPEPYLVMQPQGFYNSNQFSREEQPVQSAKSPLGKINGWLISQIKKLFITRRQILASLVGIFTFVVLCFIAILLINNGVTIVGFVLLALVFCTPQFFGSGFWLLARSLDRRNRFSNFLFYLG